MKLIKEENTMMKELKKTLEKAAKTGEKGEKTLLNIEKKKKMEVYYEEQC